MMEPAEARNAVAPPKDGVGDDDIHAQEDEKQPLEPLVISEQQAKGEGKQQQEEECSNDFTEEWKEALSTILQKQTTSSSSARESQKSENMQAASASTEDCQRIVEAATMEKKTHDSTTEEITARDLDGMPTEYTAIVHSIRESFALSVEGDDRSLADEKGDEENADTGEIVPERISKEKEETDVLQQQKEEDEEEEEEAKQQQTEDAATDKNKIPPDSKQPNHITTHFIPGGNKLYPLPDKQVSLSGEVNKKRLEEIMGIRASIVKSIREKFENDSAFDVNNLDMEKFFSTQKEQNAEYQRKRKEAIGRMHGAEDISCCGNGTGEVDHSPEVQTEETSQSTEKSSSIDKRTSTDVSVNEEENEEEKKDSEQPSFLEEVGAEETLAYVKEVWGSVSDDLSGDISSLLSFLSSGEGDAPVFPPEEIVEGLRHRRFDFTGRQRSGQSEEEWVDILLQQLCFSYLRDLEQEQIASIRKIYPSITRGNEHVEDEEVEEALSSLDIILSDLESHIDALKSCKSDLAEHDLELRNPTNLNGSRDNVKPAIVHRNQISPHEESKVQETGLLQPAESYHDVRRTITGGELFPVSRWEMLRDNSECQLKNKIVLPDTDEVEVVAVVLKVNQDQRLDTQDSHLCVLNNEKPSALKKRASQARSSHRVKFMLQQDSGAAENSTDTGDKKAETSAICCWVC